MSISGTTRIVGIFGNTSSTAIERRQGYEAAMRRHGLDPYFIAGLILAVMAIESGFNPFAQSAVGAQGLMQVMTGVHSDKYDHFGGRLAAFDPLTNLLNIIGRRDGARSVISIG